MKSFTVTIGGQTRTIPGPDDATQEQAQAEAERQMQASQAADVRRDFSGPGHLLANAAQGAASLVGGPAQLLGAKAGPAYQTAEKQPTTLGDKAARFAGATLPLAGVGAAAAVPKAVATVAPTVENTGLRWIAGRYGQGAAEAMSKDINEGIDWISSRFGPEAGEEAAGKMASGARTARTLNALAPKAKAAAGPALNARALAIPAAAGAVEGSGAPADSDAQRGINTAVGAVGGMVPGMPAAAGEAVDHLAGMGLGGVLGHSVGGPLGGLASIWGARLGNQMSHYAPIGTYARALLSRFPPSVVGRMLADAGYPVSKIMGSEYDYLGRTPGGDQGQ
ncbi:MAG TPA: hypothetical protein VHT52_04160 [Stellaceae bacterium]|jgi:hypothetical protein|nr:hypothetical protein [Stellaceae bacterium]